LAEAAWKESDHPRDDDGKFGEGGHSGQLKTTKSGSSGGAAAKYDKDAKSWSAEGIAPERLKALAIPPAWTDVRIAADPGAPLQVVGYDAKGRAQYRYSAEHAKSQSARKFARMAGLVKQRKALEAATRTDRSDTAAAVRLMLLTGMRPGGEANTQAEKQAYGATTLRKDHVSVDGNLIRFDFTGKKGVRIRGSVSDPALATLIERKLGEPGDKLFDTSAAKANQFVKATAGGDYKSKDLRTMKANEVAAEFVRALPVPRTSKERMESIKAVATAVSQQLGNTPAVALKDYINELVFSPWALPHAA
jgi:DNA topoisomerase-1